MYAMQFSPGTMQSEVFLQGVMQWIQNANSVSGPEPHSLSKIKQGLQDVTDMQFVYQDATCTA